MADYYASPNGNDSHSGKTEATAWRYLSTAARKLGAGDTLHLMDGVYEDGRDCIVSQDSPIPSGESWDRAIRVVGSSRDRVTLRPTNRTVLGFTEGAPHYWIFQDFTVDGSTQSDQGEGSPELIYSSNGSHHIRFERLRIGSAMCIPMHFSINNVPAPGPYGAFHEIIDCEFHDAGNSMNDGDGAHTGINNGYLIYTQTDDNLFQRNWFHTTRGSGTVCYGSRNRWYQNWWEGCGDRGGPAYAHVFASASHVDSNGQALQHVDNEFVNNVVVDNPQGGVMVYTNSARTKLLHNTILRNGGFAIMVQYTGGPTEVHNNILLDHEQTIYIPDGSVVNQSHNFTSGDPKFMLEEPWDYRLTASSPCRDAGAEVGVQTDHYDQPRTSPPDIGAMEYVGGDGGGGGVTPPPTATTWMLTGEITQQSDGSLQVTGTATPAP